MSNSLKLGQAAKSNSVLAPAGNHVSRCFSVIDLGSHTETGKFGTKTNRKIKISWELTDELHTFKEEKGPEPFSLHRMFNFSTNEKATLRLTLEAWRGRPFTAEELESFDLKDLVGVPCMLNVVHAVREDKTYANIQGVSPIPKSLKGTLPAQHNPSVFYTISQGKDAAYEKLPDFLKEQIAKCEEWSKSPESGGNGLAANGSIQDDNPFDSDVPF